MMAPATTRHFVSIGSNVAPHYNTPRILHALLDFAPTLHVSRIAETLPVGLVGGSFLNLVVALETALPAPILKEQFNALEVALGRDRRDPQRKVKSRPADLDILFSLPPSARQLPNAWLPSEPYIRPMLVELLLALGFLPTWETPQLPPGVVVRLNGLQLGAEPVTMMKRDGQVWLEQLRFTRP